THGEQRDGYPQSHPQKQDEQKKYSDRDCGHTAVPWRTCSSTLAACLSTADRSSSARHWAANIASPTAISPSGSQTGMPVLVHDTASDQYDETARIVMA